MTHKHIITASEALECVGSPDTVFVDGSWYLPAQNRNGKQEYETSRIPGAVYFDIDAISDRSTDLPHMLPTPEEFKQAVEALGISSDQHIVVYDGPGLFSAARVWWTFRIMGAQNVKILEGGIDAWRKNGLPTEEGTPAPKAQGRFEVKFDSSQVIAMDEVEANIASKQAITIDARPNDRFRGTAPEPRAGMRSGHIPGSNSVPTSDVVKDGKLLSREELEAIFAKAGIGHDTPAITTCGSGVTAAILVLALEETGRTNHKLFDGSWAQWGKPDGPEVARDE